MSVLGGSSHIQLPGIGVFGTGTAVRCLVPILKGCGFKVEALWGQTRELAVECAKDLGINFCTCNVDEVCDNMTKMRPLMSYFLLLWILDRADCTSST